MDKKFLEDYETKEREKIKKFYQRLRDGKFRLGDRYPSEDRLELNEPYTKAISEEKIWAQIPLYETVVISLRPTNEQAHFEEVHGFDIEDIGRLIDFAKETKKIQFALSDPPIYYEGISFLEPVFTEMSPPMLLTMSFTSIFDDEEIRGWEHEIVYLLRYYQFFNFLKSIKKSSRSSEKEDLKRFVPIYVALRTLGYHDVADEIAIQLSIDHMKALLLFLTSKEVLLSPYIDPLKGIISTNRSLAEKMAEALKQFNPQLPQKMEYPCEVGKFLNDKLKLIVPKNIDGAIELSDKYELYDLRKVMNALNEGVKKEKMDMINEKTKEVAMVFDNVWGEADKLKGNINIAKHGISIGIGVIGAVATMPILGVGGLLAGLGFTGVSEFASPKISESLAEKMMKWTRPSHMIHIYDFKKKYSLSG